MNTLPEKIIIPGTKLSRIYKTDPFGFPLYPYDEQQHKQTKEEQGLNPDAISDTRKTYHDDKEQSDPYNSVLNM